MTLKLIIITTILLALAVGGIAIKMFLQKNGQFTKSCSSNTDKDGKPIDCICAGHEVEQECPNYAKHHESRGG